MILYKRFVLCYGSLAMDWHWLEQSIDCPSAMEVTLSTMGEIDM